MSRIVGWADRSRSFDLTLGRTFSARNAAERFNSGFPVAAELEVASCERASITLRPKERYVRVEFLNWPEGRQGKAQLHFWKQPDGSYALGQLSLTRGKGPKETWAQHVTLTEGQPMTAILDVVSTETRYQEPLAGSQAHAEVAAMRFAMRTFGDLDQFVRPDLIERCMLAPNAFDPELDFGLDGPATPESPAASSRGM